MFSFLPFGIVFLWRFGVTIPGRRAFTSEFSQVGVPVAVRCLCVAGGRWSGWCALQIVVAWRLLRVANNDKTVPPLYLLSLLPM